MKRQGAINNDIERVRGRATRAAVRGHSQMMAVVLAFGMLTGCAQAPEASEIGRTEGLAANSVAVEEVLGADFAFEFDSKDLEIAWEASSAVNITLEDSGVKADGPGVVIEGGRVQIVQAGTYVLRGTLSEGQIVVNVSEEEQVHLVLNSASVTNTQGAALVIEEADRTYITLAAGTVNQLADAVTAEGSESEVDGVLYSNGDLTLNGSGTLVVEGRAGHGIVSKDDLRITGGTYEITALSDGIRGKDLIAVKEGVFSIVAGSDGLQSSNAEDEAKGFIYIEAGAFKIKAGADGIQAETLLMVQDGTFDIESGGGSANGVQRGSADKWMFDGEPPADGTRPQRGMPPAGMMPGAVRPEAVTGSIDSEDTQSAKGLKAGTRLVLMGGQFNIDCADDGLHSNDSLIIAGGTYEIQSGDDGLHADVAIVIKDGDLKILKSYEGIESAKIILQGGEISVVSSDDGINTSVSSDMASVKGNPGQKGFDAADGSSLLVEGGFISVNAGGDGVDLNGSGEMTGGTLLIHGPASGPDSALDYNGDFLMTGGVLVAVGSSEMAQAPGASSTALSAQVFLTPQAAGTILRIEGIDGTELLTFKAEKGFSSLVFSTPELKAGGTYALYAGGTSAGADRGGLITGGSYSGGEKCLSLTLEGAVTQVTQEGAAVGGMGRMKRPGN